MRVREGEILVLLSPLLSFRSLCHGHVFHDSREPCRRYAKLLGFTVMVGVAIAVHGVVISVALIQNSCTRQHSGGANAGKEIR